MKTIFAVVLALAVSASALAQPREHELCRQIGQAASVTMEARQAGVAMSNVMSNAADTDILKKIVIDAYSYPRFGSSEFRDRAVEEFRNKWELACFQLIK
jgi:hypothetical protein